MKAFAYEKPMNEADHEKPTSFRVIGAAIQVHRRLGAGLLESLYENALCLELSARQIRFERQKRVQVSYRGHDIGHLVTDLVVEDRLVVEVKAVQALAPIHTAQLLTYLKLLNLRAGLLINFNVPRLSHGLKRIVL